MPSPLERAVEVMDQLRSPGGCPWDAAQTHESLVRYLVEEAYEVIEAIETADPVLLREELGDLLLQVLFHARIAQELPADTAFGIDDVAAGLVDKLVRRHPHVFAGEEPGSAAELDESWEARKIAEKGRTSAVDGVPLAQPALALTAKLISRATRAGLATQPAGDGAPDAERQEQNTDEQIGRRLFAVVADAVTAGVDAEGALRRRARVYRDELIAAESSAEGSATDATKCETRQVARGELPAGATPP